MKDLLFGWAGKKLFELTILNIIVFWVELIIFIILASLLIGFIICIYDDIKFKKKMKRLKKKYDEE